MIEEQTPIDIEIQLPTELIQVDLKIKYSFLYNEILENEQSLNLFHCCVQLIREKYPHFDKMGQVSGCYIVSKLLLFNVLTQENYIDLIEHYFNDLNTKYTAFTQSLSNPYSKSDKLRKFSNNYLLENNYEQQIHSLQQDNQNV